MAVIWIAQWLLSGLILLSTIVLLGMGIVIIVVSLAAILEFNKPELHSAAALLKVDSVVTQRNLGEVLSVLCIVGYGTVNIATLAVCAASGRRRAHSAVAAAGSGFAAFLYLSLLLSFIRPRIGTVSKLMDDALERYYNAFQLTGDEKFLSQIQLQSGCCGLDKGPEDFQAWKRPVPSSCCGRFTGNCTLAKSRRTPCRKAIKNLSGSDGLYDCGYISWLLGIACGVMGGLLVLLTLGGGSDGFETLLSVRMTDRQEEGVGDEKKNKKKKEETKTKTKTKTKAKDRDLSEQALLTKRDKEIHAALRVSMTPSVAAATAKPAAAAARGGGPLQAEGRVALPSEDTAGTERESRFQVQELLQRDIRQRGGGAERQSDYIRQFVQRRRSVGGMHGQLEEKLIRELEKERQRLAAAQTERGGGGRGGVGSKPTGKELEEKLAREKKKEQQRQAAVQDSQSGSRGGGGVTNKALEKKLRREADIQTRRAKAIVKDANRRPPL